MMTMVEPLPQSIVQSLAAKLKGGQLVLFVGAGISFQARSPSFPDARMPLWRELAERVAQENHQSLRNYDNNLLDLFDDIAAVEGRDALEGSVRRALRDDIFEPSSVHKMIASLPFHLVFTTNYDTLLQRAMGQFDAIVSDNDFMKLRRPVAEQPRLIHLHGDLTNMHTLTGEDYDNWEDRHPVAKSTLIDAGITKTFLFIGYSNSDPHLRRGLFPLIRKLGQGRLGKNYAWMWKATPEQIRVLDRNSGLSVQTLDNDRDWLRALEQIQSAYTSLMQGESTKSLVVKGASEKRAGWRRADDTLTLRLNGYKLFYHRTSGGISIRELARRSGIDWRRINRLESVKKTRAPGEDCFALSSRDEVDSIESALSLRGVLEYGVGDDFLATYIMYYKVNSGLMGKKGSNNQLTFKPNTKAVVFDFGGTLTLPNPPFNTWERLWLSVGYSIEEAGDLHRLFVAGRITHQDWCDQTCERLRLRNFSKSHLDGVASSILPIPGLQEAVETLADRAIPIYIVSGSIRQIVRKILGDTYARIEEIKCNDIVFDEDGLIREIRGHDFDFEGKSIFIKRVIEARRCPPLEVLFVGNSLNDHWAIRSGARTLCVNPSHTDYTNSLVWSNYIKEMSDLRQILDHI